MKRVCLILLVVLVTLGLVACQTTKSAVKPKSKKAPSGSLLEGVGAGASHKNKSSKRLELKAQFKQLVTAYLAEDKDAYLAMCDNNLTLVGNALLGKPTQATKADLATKLDQEFQASDLTQTNYKEAFGPTNEPWVMSAKQLSDKIPAWRFGIHYNDLRQFVKPGDFLVIGKPSEKLMEKNIFLNDIYFIFRKQGERWVVVGRD